MAVQTFTSKEKLAEITSYFAQYDSNTDSSEDEPEPSAVKVHSKVTSIERNCAYKFNVHLSTSLVKVTPYRAVIFDIIKTNSDGCYNATTGRFNAPVKGVYVFFLSVTMTGTEWPSLCVIHNFHPVDQSKVHTETRLAPELRTKSQGVVLKLEKNDEIWVLNVTRITLVERLSGQDYSSFSGELLTKL